MAVTIINVPKVDESTAEALKKVQEQESILDQIDRDINSMSNSVWDSPAQRAYAESFRQSKARIQSFNQSVIQSLDNMKNFVTECVRVDNETAKELLNVIW